MLSWQCFSRGRVPY